MTWVKAIQLVGVAALAAGAAAAAERKVFEAVMVRVNDRITTVSEFRDRLQQELSQQPEPKQGEELTTFAEQLLEGVVEEMVLLERAQQTKLTVDDEDVENAIKTLREENQLQDDAAFEQALGSSGITIDGLRKRYRHGMLVRRAVQSEVQAVEITEEELRRLYEAEREERFRVPAKAELEQLFFPVAEDGSDRSDVKRRAQGLVERVREGSDLVAEATLAGVEVEDLGSIPEADLRPEVTQALAALQEGGLSDPLDAPGGFQVLRLVKRIPAGFQPFEEVKERLRRRQSQASYEEQTRGLVEQLKKQYLVEAHKELIPLVLEGAAGGRG